jgi:hypothetical protein
MRNAGNKIIINAYKKKLWKNYACVRDREKENWA